MRPHLGTFGGLFWGHFSTLSSLFSLLSSLFSLLSSLCSRCCSILGSLFALDVVAAAVCATAAVCCCVAVSTEQVADVCEGLPWPNRLRVFARIERRSWEVLSGWYRHTNKNVIWYSVPSLAVLPFMGGARINCQLRCCCCLWRLLGIALLEPCIRPSTSPPTASTLCGSFPGPAECAKRLNNINKNNA